MLNRVARLRLDVKECAKEDLEKYWERTASGLVNGTFFRGMERLFQRMMSPNADLRSTAKCTSYGRRVLVRTEKGCVQ